MADAGTYYFDTMSAGTLTGNGSFDPDGMLVSFLWECVSDAVLCDEVQIAAATDQNTSFTVSPGLDGGLCFPIQFRLTVTDNGNPAAMGEAFATGMACPEEFGGGGPGPGFPKSAPR